MSFKINGFDLLKIYKIVVTKCTGIFDMPARISPSEREWHDEDGVEAFVNEEDIHFKQRLITLYCTSICDSVYDFQNIMTEFREAVYDKCMLSTPYGDYEVVMKQGAKLRAINSYTKGRFNFQLVFNELKFEHGEPPESSFAGHGFAIDEIDLKNKFNIIVEECEGQFDFTKMKSDKVTRYMRESDLVNKRGVRDITLTCTMFADDLTQFATQMSSFHALLATKGLRQLKMPLVLSIPKVYCKDGFKLNSLVKHENLIAGSFRLVLRETNPQDRDAIAILVLVDTNRIPILTAKGEYIYVNAGTKKENTYLFLPSENQEDVFLHKVQENQEDIFLT